MRPKEQEQAPTVDQDRARDMFERGSATFVDVRGVGPYERAHVPGAISAQLIELPRHMAEIPRDRPVITYCA